MCWLGCYALAVGVGVAQQATVFPIAATLLNVGWETYFAWSPAIRYRWQRAIYRGWLGLDLLLFAQACVYGQSPPTPLWVAGLCGGVGLGWLLQRQLYLRFQQPYLQAFAINLLMSGLFVQRALQGGLCSPAVGWLKLLGTAAISAANVLGYVRANRAPRLPTALMSAILVLDALYLMLA